MTITNRKIKCPKCGGSPFSFIEIGICSATFAAKDGKPIREVLQEHLENHLRVEAFCDICHHQWTIKGVQQVTDLVDIDEWYGKTPK